MMRSITIVLFTTGLLTAGCAHTPPTDPPASQPVTAPSATLASTLLSPVTSIGDGIDALGGTMAQWIGIASGNTPAKYAAMMESPSPDSRRIGINGLVQQDFAKHPPYTSRYVQIASNDPDPVVRAVAIRALNRSRDKRATGLYIKALSDPSVEVRLEGAKALNRMADSNAIQPLLRLLTQPDENKDVRIAAAEALRHYKTLEVARTLTALLGDRDFGLAFQARRSLKALTGRDLRYDEAAWLEYLTGPEKPFG